MCEVAPRCTAACIKGGRSCPECIGCTVAAAGSAVGAVAAGAGAGMLKDCWKNSMICCKSSKDLATEAICCDDDGKKKKNPGGQCINGG